MISIQLVESTTWAQFTGHQTDFHCMLINNGALLICSWSKRRRKMPHTSLTYFYWHARLHGRHGKVFSEKTGTLPLFAFVSSSHWAVILSHMSECRLDGWYMLILLCEEMQNCFMCRCRYSCFPISVIFMLPKLLACWDDAHTLCVVWPEYESRVYIKRHIYNHHSFSLNVLRWTIPCTFFKGVF